MYDAHSNLAYSTVAIAPSPATSGTSLTVAAGQGALFPTVPFNCTLYPPNSNPLASNAEIVRVTNVTGDVFTIVRAQEGTSARTVQTGWQIANTATKLVFTDIENSIIQFISAGTTKASASQVVFSNSNGVSFGASGQTITASIPAASQSTQPVAASASNGSFAFSTLGFSNANGVTFGTSAGSIVTASVAAGVAAGSLSAGTASMALGQAVFSNSNGISFGLNGSTVTAQHNALTSQSNQAASASNGSFAFQTLGFSNANGVTFGSSAGSIITASVNAVAGIGISGGTESNLVTAIVFNDANGVTFGVDGSTVTASVDAAAGGAAISAGAASQNTGTVIFSASNGISFGLNAGTLTASHNGLTSQSNQAASASNGSFAFQTLGFSNANNVTFGTSAGSIITASVAAPAAGGATLSDYFPWPQFLTQVGGFVVNSASIVFTPMFQAITFTRFGIPLNISLTTAANNSTGGINFSITGVFLTATGNTLNSVLSTTFATGMTVSSNATQSVTGGFVLTCPFAGSLAPGNYWFAYQVSTNNTGGVITGAATTALAWTHSCSGVAQAVFVSAHALRELGQVTTASMGWLPFVGLYSATTQMTQIDGGDIVASASQFRAMLALRFNA
jgi:hypothetical protein